MKKLALLCVLAVACGGKIDGSDGGTPGVDGGPPATDAQPTDAQPAVDAIGPPTPACTPMQGTTSGGPNGACDTSATWSCGSTQYTVGCSCPSAQCSCTQETSGGGASMILKEPSICPSCMGDLPTICGFPH